MTAMVAATADMSQIEGWLSPTATSTSGHATCATDEPSDEGSEPSDSAAGESGNRQTGRGRMTASAALAAPKVTRRMEEAARMSHVASNIGGER